MPRLVEFLKRRNLRANVTAKVEGSAVDGRTKRDRGYAISLRCRKQIEESFEWIKTVGGLGEARRKGLARLSGQALLTFAAYNLTQLLKLMPFEPAMASK